MNSKTGTRRTRCVACSKLLVPSSTGRPRKFCSDSCRKYVNHQVRIVERRLASLQAELDIVLCSSGTERWFTGETDAERAAALGRRIKHHQQRLRSLLRAHEGES